MHKRFTMTFLISGMIFIIGCLAFSCADPNPSQVSQDDTYTLVIEGYDWGPAISKVILPKKHSTNSLDTSAYQVMVQRSTDLTDLPPELTQGKRKITDVHLSDAQGRKVEQGEHITLHLAVGPEEVLASPMTYVHSNRGGRNHWIDYHLEITEKTSGQVWKTEAGRIMPLIDDFDLDGRFDYDGELSMSYAAYTPGVTEEPAPLIIWLHGGGEGGSDPTIPLLANRAANYASPEIQAIFGGAFVLVPQCPGAWMHNAQGVYTRGKENDIYNEGLMALIRDFVSNNPNIDPNRIYVGGCSNGGYMSLKLILLYPDYFAAGFISALAYQSQYISDQQIQSIKDVPIWLVHSKDDSTTLADETAVPLYHRLKAAGASDVHFSYYDHVVDITGQYGGENYHYNGHWSWIYSHANICRMDFDGSPVRVDDRPVTIMEWMATRVNEKESG